MNGALGFLRFWIAALAVGTGFALLVPGGGYGWLLVAALPPLAIVIFGGRSKRES